MSGQTRKADTDISLLRLYRQTRGFQRFSGTNPGDVAGNVRPSVEFRMAPDRRSTARRPCRRSSRSSTRASAGFGLRVSRGISASLAPFGRPAQFAAGAGACSASSRSFELPAQRIAQRAARRSGTARGRRCAGTRRACSRTRCAARAGRTRHAPDRGGREVRSRSLDANRAAGERQAGGAGAGRTSARMPGLPVKNENRGSRHPLRVPRFPEVLLKTASRSSIAATAGSAGSCRARSGSTRWTSGRRNCCPRWPPRTAVRAAGRSRDAPGIPCASRRLPGLAKFAWLKML